MRKYIVLGKSMLKSQTAKDTFVLFAGNIGSAFWGFLFILFVARSLSVSDFGVLSAVLNFVLIIASIADLGISTGSVNFVSEHFTRGEYEKVKQYIKASFKIRLYVVLAISLVVAVFAPMVSQAFLASRDPKMALWAAAIPIFLFPDTFFPYIFQAKKQFIQSTAIDNAFYLARLVFAGVFYIAGALTIDKAFWAFGVGFVVEMMLVSVLLKWDFLYSKPKKEEYTKLLKYSGWIGVNRIISSISGRLDVQMLATMLGATATGLYSIPSRLAGFISVLTGSFSSVLAPRLSSFGNAENEKKYIIKSLIAIFPIILAIIGWIMIAKPFILALFGSKYIDSVPIFQALAAAQIPSLLSVPSVSAIVYSMKKTVYIGAYSFFQIVAIFLLNSFLIPKYGVYGPAITVGIMNSILAVYTWVIVVRYYFFLKK